MRHFNNLLANLLEEGRKSKSETFGTKSFNLSKIEDSLEKAKEGFIALANVKWLGNLKPEKIEQVFNAVIEQLGKDDNVSYESVKKSIDFALSRTLPSTNAGKWSRQFRNWIENLEGIQGGSSSSSSPSSDEEEPSEETSNTEEPSNPTEPETDQQSPSDSGDDLSGAELDLTDFQQSLYDILLHRKESDKGPIRALDLLSSVNVPFAERDKADKGLVFLNNQLKTLKEKGLIKYMGGTAWEAIEKSSPEDVTLDPVGDEDMTHVANDEYRRMTKGNLDMPKRSFDGDWHGSGWSEEVEMNNLLENFISRLKDID